MDLFSFESLRVFQNSRKLVSDIYNITETFPKHEMFGLTSQIRRAAVSIVSNISEGSGRVSWSEKVHFTEIAYGSLCETYCQLLISIDIGYLNEMAVNELRPLYNDISNQLIALKHYFITQKEQQNTKR